MILERAQRAILDIARREAERLRVSLHKLESRCEDCEDLRQRLALELARLDAELDSLRAKQATGFYRGAPIRHAIEEYERWREVLERIGGQ